MKCKLLIYVQPSTHGSQQHRFPTSANQNACLHLGYSRTFRIFYLLESTHHQKLAPDTTNWFHLLCSWKQKKYFDFQCKDVAMFEEINFFSLNIGIWYLLCNWRWMFRVPWAHLGRGLIVLWVGPEGEERLDKVGEDLPKYTGGLGLPWCTPWILLRLGCSRRCWPTEIYDNPHSSNKGSIAHKIRPKYC